MGGEVKILIVLPRFEAHLPLERRSFGYFPSLLKESNIRKQSEVDLSRWGLVQWLSLGRRTRRSDVRK